jgi:hypothetical protein
MAQYMLTTVDNPYDPFTEYEKWYAYDVGSGYYSTEFLGRIVHTSDDMSEPDQLLAIELAIDEIVKENVLGIYKKVGKE